MSRRAFTFIELLVVFAIISMTLGISAGYFFNFRAGADLRQAAQTLVAALQQARTLAVTEQAAHGVALNLAQSSVLVFRTDAAALRTEVSEPYRLAAGIVIDRTNFPTDEVLRAPAVMFSSTGTSRNGSIWLRNQQGKYQTITVLAPTGRARIYNYQRL